MKKTILAAITLLISANIFACHNWPQGSCGDSAYFKTENFYNGSILECRYQGGDGTIIYSRTMPDSGSTDKLYGIAYPFGVQKFGLEWHYYYQGVWTDWLTDSSINTDLCHLLPIEFSGIEAVQKENILTVTFSAGGDVIEHYNVQVTNTPNDESSWETKGIFKDTGAEKQKITIDLATGIGTITGAFMLLFGFKKRKLILSIFAFMLLFYSCKKEATQETIKTYKNLRIQGVSKDGKIVNSGVITIQDR